MESDFERIVEIPRVLFEMLEDVLQPDERHRAQAAFGLQKETPNLCLWTAFHQRRLIFVPKGE